MFFSKKLTEEQERLLNKEKERLSKHWGIEPDQTEEMFYENSQGQQSFASKFASLFGGVDGGAGDALKKAQVEKAQVEKAQAEKAQAEKEKAEKAQAEKEKAEKAQAKENKDQGLKDQGLFENLWDGLAGAAEAAGGGLAKAVGDGSKSVGEAVENYGANIDAERHSETLKNPRLAPNAILQTLRLLNKLYQRTELPQELRDRVHKTMEEAVKKPKLSELSGKERDEALKMMKNAMMPEEIIAKLEQQTFGRVSSSSSASSSSGSSSNGSTGTQGSGDSRASTARVVGGLVDQNRKTNGPLASPTRASVSKGSESEGDKKASTKSQPWEAVLFCKTCLNNAYAFACSSFNSMKNFFNFKDFFPTAEEIKEMEARNKEELKKRAANDKAFYEGIKESFLAPVKAARGALSSALEKERRFVMWSGTYDMHTQQGWSWRKGEVNVGSFSGLAGKASQGTVKAAKVGAGGLRKAGKGMGVLGSGIASVAGTTVVIGAFMATPSERSGRTWTERVQGAGNFMSGGWDGYGPGSAATDFAKWAASNTGESSGVPMKGAAKSAARAMGGMSSRMASMASRVANADITVHFPGR